jgi:NuA3 HAT complex component NTO1
LTKLQDKLDMRYYTTTLQFAHDLCRAVNTGINTAVKPSSAEFGGAETIEASPAKQSNYSDVKDRRRLGKRILKTVQLQLEAALKAESDICSKPLDALLKELEGMLDSSLEIRPIATESSNTDGSAASGQGQDVEMVDAPEEAQIIVADQSDGGPAADVDGEGEPDDAMDTDVAVPPQANIKVKSLDHEDNTSSKPNGVGSSGPPGGEELQPLNVKVEGASPKQVNGFKKVDSGSPPSLAAFGSATLQPPEQSDPLTPPQSNGSFGRDPANMLSEGGMPWYLSGFDLQGTSAVEEQWTGRDAVRSLSEELTDMDDDALKDLEFDVDDDTITASPVNAGDSEMVDAAAAPGSAKSARKRERANPAKFRKGVRSSTRRR